MLSRAAYDDLWDVFMIAFHMMHQSARKTIFPLTREKRIGTLGHAGRQREGDLGAGAASAVAPALGYRFDFPDRSIAFSGDTIALDAVSQMAKGADVLVHEAMDFPAIEVFVRQQIAAGTAGTRWARRAR
jgi:hypothetical protein